MVHIAEEGRAIRKGALCFQEGVAGSPSDLECRSRCGAHSHCERRRRRRTNATDVAAAKKKSGSARRSRRRIVTPPPTSVVGRWPVLLLSASVLAGGSAGAAGASAAPRGSSLSQIGAASDIGGSVDGSPAPLEKSVNVIDAASEGSGRASPSSFLPSPSFVAARDGRGHDRRNPLLAALSGGAQLPHEQHAEQFLADLSGGGRGGRGKPQSQNVVELFENEHYDPDREVWLSGSGTSGFGAKASPTDRWTSPAGDKTPAPGDVNPPGGYDFASDWKIDVTGAGVRDNLGWEYLWDADGRSGRRRRRWLRTVTPVVPKKSKAEGDDAAAEAKKASDAAAAKAAKKKGRAPKRGVGPLLLRPARALRDEWNFKGFGWSFYKSLLVSQGCGVSFRCPLSAHLDWYDRHPSLPSITSSFGAYYPNWTAVCFLNVSVHVAVVKFVLRRIYEWITFGVLTACVLMRVGVEVMTFPLNALLKAAWDMASRALGEDSDGSDATKDKENKAKKGDGKSVVILGHPLPPLPPPRKVRYSADFEERVGMSVSWRVSQNRGYEFRVSYWHLLLPTLMHLGALAGRALDVAIRARTASVAKEDDEEEQVPGGGSRRNLFRDKKLVEYLRRRSGSLGLAWGGPNPLPPRLSCSAVLSLSGFFYGDAMRRLVGARSSSRAYSRSRRASSSAAPGGEKAAAAAASALKSSSSPSSSTSSASSSPKKSTKDPMVRIEERILASKEKAEGALEQEAKANKTKAKLKESSAGEERSGRETEELASAGKKERDGGKKTSGKPAGDGEGETGGGEDEKTKVAS